MTCGLTSGDRQGNIRNGVPLHIGFESQIGLTAHLRTKIREISHKNSPFDRIGLLDRGDDPDFLDFKVFRAFQNPFPTSGAEDALHSTAIRFLPLVNTRSISAPAAVLKMATAGKSRSRSRMRAWSLHSMYPCILKL